MTNGAPRPEPTSSEIAVFTGGARLGYVNATWPFATLRVRRDELVLETSLIGTVRFRPEDVVAVERLVWFPLLAWGVRIHHVRGDAPERVIFWNLGGPDPVLAAIDAAGFVPRASASDAPAERQGFGFRIPFVVAVIVAWNALFMWDVAHFDRLAGGTAPIPGPGMVAAFALVFALSLLVRVRGPIQRLALRSPDALPRVRGFLNLLTFVSGWLLVNALWVYSGLGTLGRTLGR